MTASNIASMARNIVSGLILAGITWLIATFAPVPEKVDHLIRHQAAMEKRQIELGDTVNAHMAADCKLDGC